MSSPTVVGIMIYWSEVLSFLVRGIKIIIS